MTSKMKEIKLTYKKEDIIGSFQLGAHVNVKAIWQLEFNIGLCLVQEGLVTLSVLRDSSKFANVINDR